jgi:hypothetical protein
MPQIAIEGLLSGSWELVSWDRVDPQGQISYPFGREPRGRLFYDPNGRMSAILMNPDRAQGAAEGHSFMAYSGTYALQGDIVGHAVDLCSDPSFVGLVLRRRVVPNGAQMILETLSAAGRAERDSKHRLTWRRHEEGNPVP